MGNNYVVCKNCGARVHKTSKYCPTCGRKIEKPIYKNSVAFFCAAIIIFNFGKGIAVNRFINKVLDEAFKTLKETMTTTKRPNVSIPDLENFLNSQEPLQITPEMIRDFLNQEVPSEVQS